MKIEDYGLYREIVGQDIANLTLKHSVFAFQILLLLLLLYFATISNKHAKYLFIQKLLCNI